MPALNSGHTVGHVTTPDLVGGSHRELPVQPVRDGNVLLICFFIGMPGGLATDQLKRLHQSASPIAAQGRAPTCDYVGNRPGACRAVAVVMGHPDFGMQSELLRRNALRASSPVLVTTAMDPKYITDAFDAIALLELLD